MKKLILLGGLVLLLSGCSLLPDINNKGTDNNGAETDEGKPIAVENIELEEQKSKDNILNDQNLLKQILENSTSSEYVGYNLIGDILEIDKDKFYTKTAFNIEFNSPQPPYLMKKVYLVSFVGEQMLAYDLLEEESQWGYWRSKEQITLNQPEQKFTILFLKNNGNSFKKDIIITSQQPDNRWHKFTGQEIGLEFEYPLYWGELQGHLIKGAQDENGKMMYIYELFSNYCDNSQDNLNLCKIKGGGISSNYKAETEIPEEMYPGFRDLDISEVCDYYQADICQTYNERVAVLTKLPTFEQVIFQGPFNEAWFKKELLINLPDNDNINGLRIIYNFLPRYYDQDFNFLAKYFKCEDKSCSNFQGSQEQIEFDQMRQILENQIKNNNAPELIQQRIDDFEHVLNSIKVLN